MKCISARRIATSLFIILFFPLAVGYASADEPTSNYSQEIVDLLKDPNYTETVTLLEDVNIQESYTVTVYGSENGEKVLDLNGHTLLCQRINNYANFRVIDSAECGTLVLNQSCLTNFCKLTVDGATIRKDNFGCAIRNRWTGIFHLISGQVFANTEVSSVVENQGGTCIIDGGTIRGGISIDSTQGTELYPVYGYDEEGGLIGTTGVRSHNGSISIRNGLLEGGIQVRATDISITGGRICGWIGGVDYRNATNELISLPNPTYELHEDNGEVKRGYWDVSKDDWFYKPVQSLMDRSILGYGKDGNFGPTESLTRGQAAALISRCCGVETEEKIDFISFYDVSVNTQYAKYINALQKVGILSGDGQGQFRPENYITRQEFAVLVMNAIHKNHLPPPDDVLPITFTDEEAIESWALEAVMSGAVYGMWKGTEDGTFDPQKNITRSEAITILARLEENIRKPGE